MSAGAEGAGPAPGAPNANDSPSPSVSSSLPLPPSSPDVLNVPHASHMEPPATSRTEDSIQRAIKFLTHPRVVQTPLEQKREFLERKGLTREEIDEAIRRVTATQPPSQPQPPAPRYEPHLYPYPPPQTHYLAQPIRQSTPSFLSYLMGATGVALVGLGVGYLTKKFILPAVWRALERSDQPEKADSTAIAKDIQSLKEDITTMAQTIARQQTDFQDQFALIRRQVQVLQGAVDYSGRDVATVRTGGGGDRGRDPASGVGLSKTHPRWPWEVTSGASGFAGESPFSFQGPQPVSTGGVASTAVGPSGGGGGGGGGGGSVNSSWTIVDNGEDQRLPPPPLSPALESAAQGADTTSTPVVLSSPALRSGEAHAELRGEIIVEEDVSSPEGESRPQEEGTTETEKH